MDSLWLYGLILLGFAVLFLLARGGFRAAAKYLNRRLFSARHFPEEVLRQALALIFGATLLAAAFSVSNAMSDTVSEGYLVREDHEGLDYEAALRLETGEGSRRIDLLIEAQSYTVAEALEILAEAETRVFAEALGDRDESRILEDLHLPESAGELPVSVSWFSSDPDILGWDGRIGEAVPREGAEVELTADLIFDGKVSEEALHGAQAEGGEELLSRKASRRLRVFPKEAAADENERIREAIAGANAPESERVVLPEEIDGQSVRWSRDGGDMGVTILAMGIVLGVGLLLNSVQKAGKAAEERQRRLTLDYPYVISRLTLFLGAGLSLRSALIKMAAGYEESLAARGDRREGMEEIRRTAAELLNGASEKEAIRRLGERTGNPRYRTLAQLLLQHLERGNRELAVLLAEDSREAFEERKKEARIRGEQAGTKLVFPMMLMLGVVVVILMVPAIVNFM